MPTVTKIEATVNPITHFPQMQMKKRRVAGYARVSTDSDEQFTSDGKGELLLTIMSSLAQEESRSISQNVTWGQRKRFADGKVSLPYKHFLGYEKGEDGIPKIVPEQAEIVRTIYRQDMLGK